MSGAPRSILSLPSWRAERILYDQDGLLVVDKPAGIPVYGGDETLAHGLTERLGDFLESQGRSRHLGVHQRLDQGTSGVCLFTTSADQDGPVARAISERSLERSYLAVCRDASKRLHGEGTFRLQLKQQGDRSSVVDRGGKEAITHFRVLQRVGERVLVQLSLGSGRLHQIRVSLAHVGAPLLGDELYGGPTAERLFLHATRLSGGPLPAPVLADVPAAFDRALRGGPPLVPSDGTEALRDAVTLRVPLLRVASAFRLVNGDGDGMPGLTVDYYAGFAVLNFYDPSWLPQRERLAQELLQMGCVGVYEKRRLRTDLRAVQVSDVAPSGPVAGAAASHDLLVGEGPLSLLVDLDDGLSTGLFVDQRDNHQKVQTWARAGRVLNLFCYTGAFSVSAALAGASTTSVDLSGKALARAKRNFEQNGLDLGGHRFIKEDALKFLERAGRRGDRYDLVILDPPSFATVGKGTFSVKGGYRDAAALSVALLAPGGKLLCVTNHMKTTARQLRLMCRAVVDDSGRKLRYLKHLPAGLDCPPSAEGPFPSKSLILEVE